MADEEKPGGWQRPESAKDVDKQLQRNSLYDMPGGGVEDAVVGGLGRAVACCAHKRSLAVAYHRSSPTADGQQDVWIQVLDVEGRGELRLGEFVAGMLNTVFERPFRSY